MQTLNSVCFSGSCALVRNTTFNTFSLLTQKQSNRQKEEACRAHQRSHADPTVCPTTSPSLLVCAQIPKSETVHCPTRQCLPPLLGAALYCSVRASTARSSAPQKGRARPCPVRGRARAAERIPDELHVIHFWCGWTGRCWEVLMM